MTLVRGYPLALRTNCLGQVISRGGRKSQSSREWLITWILPSFAPREMIEQGDTVVVIGTSSVRAKRTGKTIKEDWVHIFKYNQGRMVFFQEYTDTAAAVLGVS
jgi:ketosteroid isomerase-like protein